MSCYGRAQPQISSEVAYLSAGTHMVEIVNGHESICRSRFPPQSPRIVGCFGFTLRWTRVGGVYPQPAQTLSTASAWRRADARLGSETAEQRTGSPRVVGYVTNCSPKHSRVCPLTPGMADLSGNVGSHETHRGIKRSGGVSSAPGMNVCYQPHDNFSRGPAEGCWQFRWSLCMSEAARLA